MGKVRRRCKDCYLVRRGTIFDKTKAPELLQLKAVQVILNTSFKPTTSSTQSSQVPKRVCKELEQENFKRLKLDDSISAINKSLTKDFCIQRQICVDSFNSPNRVVRRKFPGPAGLLPEIGADKSILQLLKNERLKTDNVEDMPILSQQTNSVFENGPWKEMCKDFRWPNRENLVERFNIKWIKKQALKQLLNHKAPFLAAMIQNLDIVDGKIPTINVILKDTTGDIRGTILHSLYEEYSSYFRIGSVLVLKHFGVLSAGHNNHCLSITPNNLISIYCGEVLQKLCNEYSCGENTSRDSIKKVIIQDYNVQEILNKYNEDVLTHSQEKQRKIPFGNSSDDAGTSFVPNDNSSSVGSNLLLSHISRKPHRSCENISTVAVSTSNSCATNREEFSTALTDVDRDKSPVKKKFKYKKHFSSPNDSKTGVSENAMFNSDKKVDGGVKTCDSLVIATKQICVKPDNKEHTEIWKNLLDGVDTDSLFDDF
ncbi:uncharacterized protein LOC108904097 [Anoplophora glabripennis]|uniref:uncharacterized protein LOC108904097 n=1 Tax=Anoplophora glabripennis TaxID=217634 RepID=UPI000874B6AC|nr:uncharacterized protein LOC108904097 [Anoplophora glabripennis]